MAPSVAPVPMTLPLSVIGPVDLGRIIREVETIDNEQLQTAIRKEADAKIAKTSKLLDDLLQDNHLDLTNKDQRAQLKQFLKVVNDQAPTLHISFSADPSPLFLEKLITWLRTEIHPVVLLTVGLQPSIGAGCLVRTTNKYFDFTLRENFSKKGDILMAKLREVVTA
ncbi:MAG: hypothetical protein JWM81_270 [Candidatus Saccharibacteria bacterium]|nr:hypothetical protein [Candidatus Saccharibacteria bacterium]